MKFWILSSLVIGALLSGSALAATSTDAPAMAQPDHGAGMPGHMDQPSAGGAMMGGKPGDMHPSGGFGGPMAGADANHDGVIDHAEFLAQAEKHFGEMDANHDGKVTPEEMHAFHDKMMQNMPSDHEGMPHGMMGGQSPQMDKMPMGGTAPVVKP